MDVISQTNTKKSLDARLSRHVLVMKSAVGFKDRACVKHIMDVFTNHAKTKMLTKFFMTGNGIVFMFREERRMDFKQGIRSLMDSLGMVDPYLYDVNGNDFKRIVKNVVEQTKDFESEIILCGNISMDDILLIVNEVKREDEELELERKNKKKKAAPTSSACEDVTKIKLKNRTPDKLEEFKLRKAVGYMVQNKNNIGFALLRDFLSKDENVEWINHKLFGQRAMSEHMQKMYDCAMRRVDICDETIMDFYSCNDEGRLVIDVNSVDSE